jgi:hypothetical protein
MLNRACLQHDLHRFFSGSGLSTRARRPHDWKGAQDFQFFESLHVDENGSGIRCLHFSTRLVSLREIELRDQCECRDV